MDKYKMINCFVYEIGEQVEISEGKWVVADVSTASGAIIKANNARGVAVASA